MVSRYYTLLCWWWNVSLLHGNGYCALKVLYSRRLREKTFDFDVHILQQATVRTEALAVYNVYARRQINDPIRVASYTPHSIWLESLMVYRYIDRISHQHRALLLTVCSMCSCLYYTFCGNYRQLYVVGFCVVMQMCINADDDATAQMCYRF